MMMDNSSETEKTIKYLRNLADKLENGECHLENMEILVRNLDWHIEREELNIQVIKAVNND